MGRSRKSKMKMTKLILKIKIKPMRRLMKLKSTIHPMAKCKMNMIKTKNRKMRSWISRNKTRSWIRSKKEPKRMKVRVVWCPTGTRS